MQLSGFPTTFSTASNGSASTAPWSRSGLAAKNARRPSFVACDPSKLGRGSARRAPAATISCVRDVVVPEEWTLIRGGPASLDVPIYRHLRFRLPRRCWPLSASVSAVPRSTTSSCHGVAAAPRSLARPPWRNAAMSSLKSPGREAAGPPRAASSMRPRKRCGASARRRAQPADDDADAARIQQRRAQRRRGRPDRLLPRWHQRDLQRAQSRARDV